MDGEPKGDAVSGAAGIVSGLSSDNDNNLFSIGHYDGVLRFKEPPDYDPEGDNTYSLMIMGYTGRNEASWLSVEVTVTDVSEAPAFAEVTATRAIAESTEAGGAIGEPITATDDEDDTLAYTLGGIDAASFDIVEETGQLQTRAALDHETTPSYTVTVSVSDGKDASGAADSATDDTIEVTITVTDVNEAPEPTPTATPTPERPTATPLPPRRRDPPPRRLPRHRLRHRNQRKARH